MKKTITLTLKEAQELYLKADNIFKSFLETNFSKKDLIYDICERITSLEDVFEYLEEDINDYLLFDLDIKDKRKRYLNACSLIPKIVECYNEKQKLNWDSLDCKYLPYYKKSDSGWVFLDFSDWGSYAYGSACHHYKSQKLCIKGMKTFNKIYLDYYSYQG